MSWTNGYRLDVLISFAFLAIGFAPITALATSIIGWLSLPIATLLFVVPAAALGIVLGLLVPEYGKLALKGFLIGLIAVTLYDCMRIPFILLGLWGDFIPHIGTWLLGGSEPNWMVGYLWRYIGDGGAMGLAFTMIYSLTRPRVNSVIAGIGFGIQVWLGLLLTLIAAPQGQQKLFALTPTSFGLSLLGHVIYGTVLGLVFAAWIAARAQGTQEDLRGTRSLSYALRHRPSAAGAFRPPTTPHEPAS